MPERPLDRAAGPVAVYHDGERMAQARAGVRDMADRVGRSIHSEVPAAAGRFLEERRMIFLAAAERGRPWVTVLTGKPGFVRVPDPHTLRVAARFRPDDPVAHALAAGAPLGTVAVDFASRRRARVNGRILAWDDQGLTMSVEQAYANCPKYIQRREPDGESAADGGSAEGVMTRWRGLSRAHREWIRRADTFFVATLHPESGADASHRGGNPGFVRVEGDRITWPDYAGNAMFNTLGNMVSNPRAGLLFLDFDTGATLQLTGRTTLEWDPDRVVHAPGAERLVHLDVDEVVVTMDRVTPRLSLVDYSPFNPVV